MLGTSDGCQPTLPTGICSMVCNSDDNHHDGKKKKKKKKNRKKKVSNIQEYLAHWELTQVKTVFITKG